MKTKFLTAILFASIFLSCGASPEYLPESDELDIGIYGSYISLTLTDLDEISGELISVNDSNFIVLTGYYKKIEIIPLRNVSDFKVKYAQGREYGAIIPIFTLLSLAHGYYAAVTIPLNLIVTITVAVTGEDAFTYKRMDITLDDLKMFARFPQGIPQGVELKNLK